MEADMATIPTTTSAEVTALDADTALLPVGSWEQHGDHLPLATDAIIASTLAHRLAETYGLLELPPITIACSHEHEGVPGRPGTVSLSASTVAAVIADVRASLQRAGIRRLILVNAHGGNYVLGNVVQEANAVEPRSMGLYPRRVDWEAAREAARMKTDHSADMHAGELETSILLYEHPEMVKPSYRDADYSAPERDNLHVVGMAGYTGNGVIGFPSEATAEKGRLAVGSLMERFGEYVQLFRGDGAR
jgi:creatinine amidohydrolase